MRVVKEATRFAVLLLSAAWIAVPSVLAAPDEEDAQKEAVESATAEAMTVAVLETSLGSFTCQLFPDAAPKAVENFIGLAKRGYYEDVIFHRIISEFMIQGGDPSGTGYGGKSIWEIPFEDEISPERRFDRPGILAMANRGRQRSNGSQFFLTLKATPWLNDRHTIFGEVIEGYDVVEALGAVETGAQDKPVEEVKLLTVTIEERAAE